MPVALHTLFSDFSLMDICRHALTRAFLAVFSVQFTGFGIHRSYPPTALLSAQNLSVPRCPRPLSIICPQGLSWPALSWQPAHAELPWKRFRNMVGMFLPPGNKWICRKTTMESEKELSENSTDAKEAGCGAGVWACTAVCCLAFRAGSLLLINPSFYRTPGNLCQTEGHRLQKSLPILRKWVSMGANQVGSRQAYENVYVIQTILTKVFHKAVCASFSWDLDVPTIWHPMFYYTLNHCMDFRYPTWSTCHFSICCFAGQEQLNLGESSEDIWHLLPYQNYTITLNKISSRFFSCSVSIIYYLLPSKLY